VYLSGDILYAESDNNLHVYSMSDLTSPIVTYPLDGRCYSAMITDDHLYLGGNKKLYVFKVSESLTQPLISVTSTTTKSLVNKILRLGNELLLGQDDGHLEVLDIKTSKIMGTHSFAPTGSINDMIAIDDTYYMLAVRRGLLKVAYEQVISYYLQGMSVDSLCHLDDSVYLVGFTHDGLVAWDEKKDQLLFKISKDEAFSIKRVLTTNSFLIKTGEGGVKVLTIDDLKSKKFSLKLLLEA
jgi:hypothetical protein